MQTSEEITGRYIFLMFPGLPQAWHNVSSTWFGVCPRILNSGHTRQDSLTSIPASLIPRLSPHTHCAYVCPNMVTVPIGACRPGHCLGYFKSCVLISQGLDAKTPIFRIRAYPHTDVRYTERKPKNKKRGRPGNEAKLYSRIHACRN